MVRAFVFNSITVDNVAVFATNCLTTIRRGIVPAIGPLYLSGGRVLDAASYLCRFVDLPLVLGGTRCSVTQEVCICMASEHLRRYQRVSGNALVCR